MLDIHELDAVRLKDGREVTILEIFGDGAAFYVELPAPPYCECDWFEVTPDEIAEVTYRHSS